MSVHATILPAPARKNNRQKRICALVANLSSADEAKPERYTHLPAEGVNADLGENHKEIAVKNDDLGQLPWHAQYAPAIGTGVVSRPTRWIKK